MTRLRNNWRAVYAETCTYGSEGGSEKPCLVTGKGAWFLPYKTTSATNIAFGLVNVLRLAGAPNPRVLLVDTDSQGHATIERSSGAPDFRLFNVTTSGSLTLENVSIRNGRASSGNGGAIQTTPICVLTLISSACTCFKSNCAWPITCSCTC